MQKIALEDDLPEAKMKRGGPTGSCVISYVDRWQQTRGCVRMSCMAH